MTDNKSFGERFLRTLRHLHTRLLGLSRIGSPPIFYKDDLYGKFSGNILEKISPLFPHPYSERIATHEPIYSEWKVYERITWEGANGYRYYVSKGTSIRVFEVMNAIYPAEHQLQGYPGTFVGTKDNLPSFSMDVYFEMVNGKEEKIVHDEYFVIWLPQKVEIPRQNNE